MTLVIGIRIDYIISGAFLSMKGTLENKGALSSKLFVFEDLHAICVVFGISLFHSKVARWTKWVFIFRISWAMARFLLWMRVYNHLIDIEYILEFWIWLLISELGCKTSIYFRNSKKSFIAIKLFSLFLYLSIFLQQCVTFVRD